MDDIDEGFLQRPDITDRLPGYRLLRELSRTQMSEVFLAAETVNNRQVALKIVGQEFTRNGDFRSRFERESAIAIGLEHPNVVPAYASGTSTDDELCYLAMRFIHGVDLLRMLDDRGALGIDETISIARQVAAALDAAHEHGLIHRDVKPANILIEAGTNQVYLGDFGIAKSNTMPRLTVTGTFLGTPLYAAPEQVRGEDVDRRADVYSLGRVIQHCLTGRPPEQFLTFKPPVERVLRKALAADPAQRYPTCGALVKDLAASVRRDRVIRRGAGIASAAIAITATVMIIAGGVSVPSQVDRVVPALRVGCETSAPAMAGATSSLSCQHGSVISLFDRADAMTAAYDHEVQASRVARTQGDCAKATGAEHRYPATGPARGRVLCYSSGGQNVVVWTDEQASTVSRASVDGATWASWTGDEPAFPTADERATLDVAAGSNCVRATPAALEPFPAAVAGITCVPNGSGAQQVSYFRFGSLDLLRDGMSGLATSAKPPSGVGCSATTPQFLGTSRENWHSVDLGRMVCHPDAAGVASIDWSMEPLLVIGRVEGNSPAAATDWWNDWHLAPLSKIVDSLNAHSSPPFPSDAEKELLGHIPAVSRVGCVRPSADQIWRDVGATPVTAVACGPTSGAQLVVYYRFRSQADMSLVYGPAHDSPDTSGHREPRCTESPESFNAEHSYPADGTRVGRLGCETDKDTGERTMRWTDDPLAVIAVAHQGTAPYAMVDWWTHDAGPY